MAYEISDDDSLRIAINLLGDINGEIKTIAKNQILETPYHNGQLLIESLSIPKKKVREHIFEILKTLNITGLDYFQFAKSRIKESYRRVAESETLSLLKENQTNILLIDHINQQKDLEVENVLRVLALMDQSDQLKYVLRGIFSTDNRQKANSLEAMNNSLDHSLSKIIVPLVDNSPPSQKLAKGRKYLNISMPIKDVDSLLLQLASRDDWVTSVLALNIIEKQHVDIARNGNLQKLLNSKNSNVQQVVQRMVNDKIPSERKEFGMVSEMDITGKIMLMKQIYIFEGLTVGELAAVASVTEEANYNPGNTVVKEGDTGDTMYMIINGEVSVLINNENDKNIEIDRMDTGDFFGEMAFFRDAKRSATIRVEQDSRVLVIHKHEFNEIVREYPQIALKICKVLSDRIHHLHKKVRAQ
ncbi:MAG: cyclic nucleotide-binding domain-containing protein [Nitrospinales bacterium]